jgi:hypothetical protein
MSADHNRPTSHRGRRSEAGAISGKCVACASSIVAGIAGMGLSWLPSGGLAGTGVATRAADITLTTSGDPLADPFMNDTIVLPGADDTFVLPSGNVINLPFGGDGFNNFFGPGLDGVAGGTSTADIATGDTWSEFTTPVEEFTIPFLNDTIILPGSNDTIVYLSDPFSGNAINLPFFGDGENDFFGSLFPETGSALSNAGVATGSADTVSSIPTESVPTDAIVLPGSADTIVFPSFNTINLPFGGDGENNFFGGGNGGDGGVGTGVGGNSAATADETTAAATTTSGADSTLTISADPTATGDTVFSGAGETIVFPSSNTINLPFGGDGENNFFGGGNGGTGGDGTGTAVGGSGSDPGTGVGIGGAGGDGGDGAQFFPIQIDFVDSSGASADTIADSSGTSSGTSAGSLDLVLAGIVGSDSSSNLTAAGGIAIGVGGAGADGGSGAVLFPLDFDVNTADLSSTSSSYLDAFLDSLLGSGGSSAGSTVITVAAGSSESIDGAGGAGGSAAELFPISLDWVDSSGDHSVTVTPVVLFEDLISFLGSGAAEPAAIPTSVAADLGSSSGLVAGDLSSSSGLVAGDLGTNLPALVADLGSLF